MQQEGQPAGADAATRIQQRAARRRFALQRREDQRRRVEGHPEAAARLAEFQPPAQQGVFSVRHRLQPTTEESTTKDTNSTKRGEPEEMSLKGKQESEQLFLCCFFSCPSR